VSRICGFRAIVGEFNSRNAVTCPQTHKPKHFPSLIYVYKTCSYTYSRENCILSSGYISTVVQNIVIVEMLEGKLVEDQFVILSAQRSSPLPVAPPGNCCLSLSGFPFEETF
jgi:hypothetical protein